jgi:hypothetical protein
MPAPVRRRPEQKVIRPERKTMTMGSDQLVDEPSLAFARACIELARAQLQQQMHNTPTGRAAVARCRAERDAVRSSYANPAAAGDERIGPARVPPVSRAARLPLL